MHQKLELTPVVVRRRTLVSFITTFIAYVKKKRKTALVIVH